MYCLNKKYLINCDNWFVAPDGNYYKAIFGTLKSIENAPEVLGIKVNARSMDWYMNIGNRFTMKIAGCQIHYAFETEECNLNSVKENELSKIFYLDF